MTTPIRAAVIDSMGGVDEGVIVATTATMTYFKFDSGGATWVRSDCVHLPNETGGNQ